VDRSVYIGTPLCVQVVAPKLEERRLCDAMVAIDNALKAGDATLTSKL
jgi:amidase